MNGEYKRASSVSSLSFLSLLVFLGSGANLCFALIGVLLQSFVLSCFSLLCDMLVLLRGPSDLCEQYWVVGKSRLMHIVDQSTIRHMSD